MPHTESRYQQDLGFTDGRMFCGAYEVMFSGTTAITRNAAGDWSINQGASQTVFYSVNINAAIQRRLGFSEDLQENFGGGGIPASAQPQIYRPDVIASMSSGQQLQPRTALKLKGYKLLSFDVIYLITGAALTGHTARVDQVVHANNVANAITSVLASGANGLATATQANPYVTSIALAANQQIYRSITDSNLIVEVSPVTQVAGAYRMYGIDLAFEFNWN